MTDPGTVLERRQRSYSQLNDFLHCGWQYRLKRVKKVEESPSVWLPGGKAFHTASEVFDLETADTDLESLSAQSVADLTATTAAAFVESFERQVEEMAEKNPAVHLWRTAGRTSKEKPNGEDLDWWHNAGQEMTARYIQWRITTNDTWVMATVEGRPCVEVEIRDPLGSTPLRHFVDRLFRDRRTGALVVVDLKTGSRRPVSAMQLGVYSVLLEPKVGEPVLWGSYWMARTGELTTPQDLSVFTAQNLGEVFDSLDEAATRGLFMPKLDTHCVKCGVREHCVWVGGIEPPDPVESEISR